MTTPGNGSSGKPGWPESHWQAQGQQRQIRQQVEVTGGAKPALTTGKEFSDQGKYRHARES
jgi:hypothetical protein